MARKPKNKNICQTGILLIFLKHHSNHKEHNWKEKGKIFKRKTYQWRLRTPSWTQSLKHVVLYKWADTWPFRKADFFTKIFFVTLEWVSHIPTVK